MSFKRVDWGILHTKTLASFTVKLLTHPVATEYCLDQGSRVKMVRTELLSSEDE